MRHRLLTGESGSIDLRRLAGILYLILVTLGCLRIIAPKEHTNVDITATDWPVKPDPVEVPAKPDGIWTPVLEYVRGPALISFKAEGKWKYSDKCESGPNGDTTSMISSQQALLPGAPVGALIGKIGGSTAGQSDGKVFLIGGFSVLEIDQSVRGPLYLTINDELSGMGNNSGSVKVTIAIKPLGANVVVPAGGSSTASTASPAATTTAH